MGSFPDSTPDLVHVTWSRRQKGDALEEKASAVLAPGTPSRFAMDVVLLTPKLHSSLHSQQKAWELAQQSCNEYISKRENQLVLR